MDHLLAGSHIETLFIAVIIDYCMNNHSKEASTPCSKSTLQQTSGTGHGHIDIQDLLWFEARNKKRHIWLAKDTGITTPIHRQLVSYRCCVTCRVSLISKVLPRKEPQKYCASSTDAHDFLVSDSATHSPIAAAGCVCAGAGILLRLRQHKPSPLPPPPPDTSTSFFPHSLTFLTFPYQQKEHAKAWHSHKCPACQRYGRKYGSQEIENSITLLFVIWRTLCPKVCS